MARETDNNTKQAVVSPKRQITLPMQVCESLNITAGDVLDLDISPDATFLIIRPRKNMALDALEEMRGAFARSGLSEAKVKKACREVSRKVRS
ncbi:MAG: AbrB/MazE/SpoVT family DNA-binding domain-containing protein [Dehalococcoidia bacterium]|nr:AbrB/MazE/SpoVT family DNA-binding domain-containing protein [Dehalococcoidia bacterium]